MRTLIIDDSPVARRAIRHYLTKSGYKVVGEAERAAQALRMFNDLQPDLVTLDVMMPEIDGIDSRRALRAMLAAKPELAAIIVSSVPYNKIRENYLEDGAIAYVVKPFTQISFEQARQKLLRVLWAQNGAAEEPHPVTMNNVVDASIVDGLRDEGDNLLLDLIDLFLRESPERMELLPHAIAKGDKAVIERTAHTLKSSAATFGATSMRAIAAEMETAARAGRLDQVAQMIAALKSEFDRVREVLETERVQLAQTA
jgi:two-component system chemotaxis response regulator CheY